MTEIDSYVPWHNFLKLTKERIANGEYRITRELTDFDIAVQFVIGIAYDAGYAWLTNERIAYLLKALTDVEFTTEECEEYMRVYAG